jgi:hypothetical protein
LKTETIDVQPDVTITVRSMMQLAELHPEQPLYKLQADLAKLAIRHQKERIVLGFDLVETIVLKGYIRESDHGGRRLYTVRTVTMIPNGLTHAHKLCIGKDGDLFLADQGTEEMPWEPSDKNDDSFAYDVPFLDIMIGLSEINERISDRKRRMVRELKDPMLSQLNMLLRLQ